MKARQFLRALALAAAAVPAFAAMASASPATVTTWLNVRTGPGTSYHVIGTLSPHTTVHVKHCSYGWCKINYHGYTAWVSKRYLHQGGYHQPSHGYSSYGYSSSYGHWTPPRYW